MPRLPTRLDDRLREHQPSGSDYWIVSLRLADGREVPNAAIIDGDIVVVGDPRPIRPEEIVDIRLASGQWLAESMAATDGSAIRPRVGGSATRGRSRPSPWAADVSPLTKPDRPEGPTPTPAIQRGARFWGAASRTVQRTSASRPILERG